MALAWRPTPRCRVDSAERTVVLTPSPFSSETNMAIYCPRATIVAASIAQSSLPKVWYLMWNRVIKVNTVKSKLRIAPT